MKAKILAAIIVIALIATGVLYQYLITNVSSTQYAIKQAVGTGTLTTKTEPGWMFRNFGDISKYNRTEKLYFSDKKEDLEGLDKDDFENPPIATFTGNSTAQIYAFISYQLSNNPDNLIKLHRDWKNRLAVKGDMVRNAFSVALKFASTMYAPEEAFVDRRSEFQTLVREVLEQGEFATTTITERLSTDTAQTVKRVIFKLDSSGNRIVIKPSILKNYGINVLQLDVREFVFDARTEALIAAKKDAEQSRIASRANAEKAVQDALTIKAQADADVAKREGEARVELIKETTDARKRFEVAEFAAKEANELAKKIKAEGEAEAYAARLKVSAGLSPLEKATIDKETAIGVAAELAKTKWPDNWVVIGGGGANGGKVDPFTAVGIESLMNITRNQAKK